ncbi:MAG: PD-(D/E)XK motif protein [Erysipelotrichaceae bacterium]|uniref:PD-(D/E)XK motif protein n=1 Tax=Anaerorhabdus sp. TaxID=1872524 RepID=UPI002FC9F30C
MNNKEISELFECGKNIATFRAINVFKNNGIWVGYNSKNEATLVIYGNDKIQSPISSKNVDVISSKGDNNYNLIFTLKNEEFYYVFIDFCSYLIDELKIENEEKINKKSYKCWLSFKQLFERKYNEFLSLEQIKGLVGELVFLNDYMFNKFDVYKGIDSWLGCEKAHKDFEYDNTWMEVKAADQSKNEVKISSLEQLDSHVDGYLCVVKMNLSSITSDISISLNNIVNLIEEKIKDESYIHIFREKLLKIGFYRNEYYDQYRFVILSKKIYSIKEEFPRLTKRNVPIGVNSASYKLDLNVIDIFCKEKF